MHSKLMNNQQHNVIIFNNSHIDQNQSDNSNSVIAPIQAERSKINNSTKEGGGWENHPCGEYVLLCRRHLARVEDFVDSFEHLSKNLTGRFTI
jgi:hypothetical protein